MRRVLRMLGPSWRVHRFRPRRPYGVSRQDLTEDERRRFLTPGVRAHIEAARYAVNKSFGPAEVLAMELPEGHDLATALELVRRGFRELEAVELPDAAS